MRSRLATALDTAVASFAVTAGERHNRKRPQSSAQIAATARAAVDYYERHHS